MAVLTNRRQRKQAPLAGKAAEELLRKLGQRLNPRQETGDYALEMKMTGPPTQPVIALFGSQSMN
jgi:hypothetical protein